MKPNWIVEDWAGNRMFPDKEFDTFESAWDHVHANSPEEDWEDIYVHNTNDGKPQGGDPCQNCGSEDTASLMDGDECPSCGFTFPTE